MELTRKTQPRNLQGPLILCGGQKGGKAEVSKGAEENVLGAATGTGAQAGGGRWSRVGALANPGEQRKAAPTTRPPAQPLPLQGDQSSA